MTFGDCWRLAQLHAPLPDPMLHRTWTQWAYNQFCERRAWSHLKAVTAIQVNDQKIGTCSVTLNSATVNPGTLAFVATDVGRQFRLQTIPIYTIIAVNGGNATLDRAYSEATAVATAGAVLDAYVTMPEDFHRFISVLDPFNRWRLRFWVPQEMVDRWDPARQNSGNARVLANNSFSPVPANLGQVRYELYPFQTSARTYQVWYYRKGENLTDDQPIIGPLARRASEILLEGALSRCAMWPGSSTAKNPYFSLQLAENHRKLFEEKLIEVTVTDEELYFEGMPMTEFPFADFPWDSNWLQSHEPYVIG